MQSINRTETNTSVLEDKPLAPTATNAEAGTQAPSQKITGLHKVTPSTLKSLKTSFDQTSRHFVDFGSHWKAGRLARGSVNCLRIFREITLILPRAGVAFGNDLAEHSFNILDTIADRFDGKHDKATVHHEDTAKRKPRWLAIVFMLLVLMYCFNGLKNFGIVGNVREVPSPPEKNIDDEKVEKAVKSELVKQFGDETSSGNEENAESDRQQDESIIKEPQPKAKSKASLSEKKLKTAVTNFVKEVLDSK